MRRALAIALTAAVPAVPQPSHHLLPHTVLDRPLVRMHNAAKRHRAAREARASMTPALAAIAACESNDNPSAIGGGGQYRGAFQMTYAAWASVGGQGDPAAAPMSEQIHRARLLYDRDGPTQWPICGE